MIMFTVVDLMVIAAGLAETLANGMHIRLG
jgi:hypothetical protein